MEKVVYRITLDLQKEASGAYLKMKKADSARLIRAALTDGGRPYTIADGCKATFRAVDSAGTEYSRSCSITNNMILYAVSPAVLSNVGELTCEFHLFGADDRQIACPKFTILVSNTVVDDDVVPEEDVSELAQLIADATNAAAAANETAARVLKATVDGEFVKHEWEGSTLKVTSASGTSSADLRGEKGDPAGYVPLVRFDLTRNMLDVSGDMVLPDGKPWNFKRQSAKGVRNGRMSTNDQVQGLFGSLVAKYPHLWRVEDAADYVDEAPPVYYNGINIEDCTNLFDIDRVLINYLVEDDSGNTVIDMTGTAPYQDIMIGDSGTELRTPEDKLSSLIWLPVGKYVLSYRVVGGSAVIRAFGIDLSDLTANGYASYTLTAQGYTDAEKTPSETRVVKSFEITAEKCGEFGGTYVTLRRTSTTLVTFCDVQIEEGESATAYVPYGKPAYKYREVNGACLEKLPVEATGDDLKTYYYKPTPACNTKLYKFSFQNKSMLAADGKPCQKRKLLLISGLHGDERAAPFNAYLFAKRLCEVSEEDDYFKFAQAFDVYFLPCLNGYGMYHNTRWNANGVNLNRNFNSGYRAVPQIAGGIDPIPGKQDYPGFCTTDGQGNITGFVDEWETKLFCAVVNTIKPDIACDHHSYTFNNPWQFYATVPRREWAALAYQSAADCSIAFKRKYPEYFGSDIDLVRKHELDAIPCELKDGTSASWMSHKSDVFYPVTIEVSQSINYPLQKITSTDENGKEKVKYVSTESDRFGKETFSIAEYTLRNQLMRYGQFVMENREGQK